MLKFQKILGSRLKDEHIFKSEEDLKKLTDFFRIDPKGAPEKHRARTRLTVKDLKKDGQRQEVSVERLVYRYLSDRLSAYRVVLHIRN